MARYFFNILDGHDIPDDVGTEHDDLQGVRAEAVETAAELLRGRLLADEDSTQWVMNVTDENGTTVLFLSFSAIAKPIVARPSRVPASMS